MQDEASIRVDLELPSLSVRKNARAGTDPTENAAEKYRAPTNKRSQQRSPHTMRSPAQRKQLRLVATGHARYVLTGNYDAYHKGTDRLRFRSVRVPLAGRRATGEAKGIIDEAGVTVISCQHELPSPSRMHRAGSCFVRTCNTRATVSAEGRMLIHQFSRHTVQQTAVLILAHAQWHSAVSSSAGPVPTFRSSSASVHTSTLNDVLVHYIRLNCM